MPGIYTDAVEFKDEDYNIIKLTCKRCGKLYPRIVPTVAFARKAAIRQSKYCLQCAKEVRAEKNRWQGFKQRVKRRTDLTPDQKQDLLDRYPESVGEWGAGINTGVAPTWEDRVSYIFTSLRVEFNTPAHHAVGPDLWARAPEDECEHGRLCGDRTAHCGCYPFDLEQRIREARFPGRKCHCGCGESIEHLATQARYVNEAHGARQRRKNNGRVGPLTFVAQWEGDTKHHQCTRCGTDFTTTAKWAKYCTKCRHKANLYKRRNRYHQQKLEAAA